MKTAWCEKAMLSDYGGYRCCLNKARFKVIAKSPRTEEEEHCKLCGTHKRQLLNTYDPGATVTELNP